MAAAHRPTILIVEDNASLLGLYDHVFEPETTRLIHARGVEESLRAIRSERLDLAIVDYWLPDGNGAEVLRALKEAQPHAHAILATAWGSDRDASEVVKQGAFAYLKKPFDLVTLRILAQRALLLARLGGENEVLRGSLRRFAEEVSAWGKEAEAVRRLATLPAGPEDAGAHCAHALSAVLEVLGGVGLAYYSSPHGGGELALCHALGFGGEEALPAAILADQGLVGRAAEEGRLLSFSGAAGGPVALDKEKGAPFPLVGYTAAAALPVELGGRSVGVLVAAFPDAGSLARAEETLGSSVGRFFSLAMQNIHLMEAAAVDGLTGLYNRRYLDLRLEQEFSRAERHGRELTLCLADLDQFKSLNDAHGHQFGDKVLRGVADCWRSGLRKSDLAARYGGEELALLLPETSLAGGRLASEKIRGAISALPFAASRAGGAAVRVTASIGVASYPGQAAGPEELLRAADQALYEAKNTGGDRVVCAPRGG
ncbi:MAG: diguanylate cyclase [Nitrospinota bacterium]